VDRAGDRVAKRCISGSKRLPVSCRLNWRHGFAVTVSSDTYYTMVRTAASKHFGFRDTFLVVTLRSLLQRKTVCPLQALPLNLLF